MISWNTLLHHQSVVSKFNLPNMSEKFFLKWNDFTDNVSKSFGLLRNEEYLHDVTLVIDDHKQVPAHKLVLSACSEYFRDIFKNTSSRSRHSHPLLLCLDGISSTDLENILEYIYNGEIQIYQDNLDRFLSVAQRFKLEGLLNEKPEEEVYDPMYENIKEEIPLKMQTAKHDQLKAPKRSSRDLVTVDNVSVSVSSNEMEDIKNKINENLEKCEDGRFRCTLCGKISNGTSSQCKQNIQRHIESSHIEGISFSCTHCEKTFRSRYLLKSHKYTVHK